MILNCQNLQRATQTIPPHPLEGKSGCRTRIPARVFSMMLVLLFPFALTANALAAALGSAESPIRMTFVPSGDTQVILESGNEIARMLKEFTGLHFESS